jgi:hypothetical protein
VNGRSLSLLLVAVVVNACASHSSTTRPAPPPPPKDVGKPINLEGPQPVGAASPREAVDAFLEAARTQDIQAMSAIWGSTQGPAREYSPHDVTEKRLLIMMCFLKHDKSTVGGPSAVAGGRLEFPVTLSQGDLTKSTTITTIPGPNSRYYVETFDMKAVEPLCQQQGVKTPPQNH